MDLLKEFLMSRSIPEENINKMEEEKIDCSVILEMKDEELAQFVPKYGDRVSVVAYSKRQSTLSVQESAHGKESTSMSLMDRLKAKIGSEKGSTTKVNNKNAIKESRKVELGWLDFDLTSHSYKQVRMPMGGGTVSVNVARETSVKSLREQAKTHFFPNGKNRKGKINDFEFEQDMRDYNQHPVDPIKTVAHLYEESKRGMLRLYLCSKLILLQNSSDEFQKDPKKQQLQHKKKKNKTVNKTVLKISSSSDEDDKCQQDKRGYPDTKRLKQNMKKDTCSYELEEEAVNCTSVAGPSQIEQSSHQTPTEPLDQPVMETVDLTAPSTSSCGYSKLNYILTDDGSLVPCPSNTDALMMSNNLSGQLDDTVPMFAQGDSMMDELKVILQSLNSTIDITKVSRFNINRDCIFEGALRGFKRSTYHPSNDMMCRFTDDSGILEDGIDSGGPRREFLRLLMKHIQTSCLFTGPHDCRLLNLDSRALRDGEYFIAGRAMAVSLAHGGPAPNFLSPVLYSLLAESPLVYCASTVNDITDQELRQKVEQIQACTSIEDLEKTLETHEQLLDLAGCLRPTNMESKDTLVEDLVKWLVVGRNNMALQSFKDGIQQTFGMLEVINTYPQLFSFAFTEAGRQQLTTSAMENLFKVTFSAEGTNRKRKEGQVLAHWLDFLQDLEDGDCHIGEHHVTLPDLLIFATGASQIPSLGFDEGPSLEFMHDPQEGNNGHFISPYPIARTCTNLIKLPVMHKKFEDFRRYMLEGIVCAKGFGLY